MHEKSHDEHLCIKKLISCYLKIPPCTIKLWHGQVWIHVRKYAYFDNYVELSAIWFDKFSLTTKHNTSKHQQDTVRTAKFWEKKSWSLTTCDLDLHFTQHNSTHHGEYLFYVVLKSTDVHRSYTPDEIFYLLFYPEVRPWLCHRHLIFSRDTPLYYGEHLSKVYFKIPPRI
jgi:hypothetical protein